VKISDINVPRWSVPASTLTEAALVREVVTALRDWQRAAPPEFRGVLIGGMARAFYAPPRYTQDVDIAFADEGPTDPPEGFRKHRQGAFEHAKTGVEIEIVTPDAVGLPASLFRAVVDTAVVVDGVSIASLEGLIALKLASAEGNPKRELRDHSDVLEMLEANPTFAEERMADWNLSHEQSRALAKLLAVARS
jgi:hypothetical protein